MSIETTLTDELRTVATELETPPPPVAAELVRQAEKQRMRSRLRTAGVVGVAAAAVLAAIAIGSQAGKPDASPAPAPQPTELPTGAPVRIPYVREGALHAGDRAWPGLWQGVRTIGDVSVATMDKGSEITTVLLLRDGLEYARFTRASWQQPALLSPDGSKLALVEIGRTTAALVEVDTRTGQERGRVPVDRKALGHLGPENEGWESLSDLANDGTVTFGGVLGTHTWKPGTAVVDHDADFGSDAGSFAGYPQDADYVWVSADQRWGAWLTDRQGHPVTDPSRAGSGDGLTVQRPDLPESRITIPLPGYAQGIDWETSTDLLLTYADDPDGNSVHFVRCSITTRACEQAPTP